MSVKSLFFFFLSKGLYLFCFVKLGFRDFDFTRQGQSWVFRKSVQFESLLRGTTSQSKFHGVEVWGNNRSVMPFRCSGPHARYTDGVNERWQLCLPFTLTDNGLGNLLKLRRAGDRSLELLILNEEFLVSVSHQLALITSLPFVHTARRSYRLNGPVKFSERRKWCCFLARESTTFLFKNKNKAKLTEPYHLEEGEVVTRYP